MAVSWLGCAYSLDGEKLVNPTIFWQFLEKGGQSCSFQVALLAPAELRGAGAKQNSENFTSE